MNGMSVYQFVAGILRPNGFEEGKYINDIFVQGEWNEGSFTAE